MALIAGRMSRFGGSPLKRYSAPSVANVSLTCHPQNFGSGGGVRNFPAGWASITANNVTIKEGRPTGHSHPGAWVMPQKAGGLASRNEADFSITAGAAGLAQGIALEGDLTATMTAGSASLAIVVSLDGDATITFTQTGTLAGASGLSGAATITMTGSAAMGAIVGLAAAGSFTVTGSADLKGKAWLSGDITPFTELSPQNLALAVWNQILEAGFSAGDIMRILAAVAAGETDITTGPVVVTFTGLDGVTQRVVADMTDSERTSVTIDAEE